MALQYDNPVWTNQIVDALAANPGISETTSAAISQLLKLDTAESVVVAGWDGVAADVTAPVGKVADVVAINVDGNTATDLTLPESVADAKVVIIESDADVSLTVGNNVATASLLAAAVEPIAAVDKVVVGGNGNDTLTVLGNVNAHLDGGDGNDTLTTGAGNDVVIGGRGDDTIDAGAGNDIIVTGLGHDTIDAGAGRDMIQVEGASTGFAVSVAGDSLVLTGTGLNVANAVDVKNAEFLTFNDGHTLAIAETDAEASALRLYQGLLGRDADDKGAEAFTQAVDNGASLTDVTKMFLSSAEFQNNANDAFVENLYTSLLNRSADEGGEAAWLNMLANGGSRADVAAQIANSAEAQSQNLGDDDFVNALYQGALGRSAEQEGLDGWVAQLTAGSSRADVANQVFGSSEAATHTNASFIDSLYQNALGRTADDVGKAGWVAALDHGATQAEVAIGIVGSPEAQDHITNVVVVHGAV